MRRFILVVFLLISSVSVVFAGEDGKKTLRFSTSGQFRIMQLTDLHLRPDMPQENVAVYKRICGLAQLERPDYIVVTGDVLWGSPASGILKEFLDVMDGMKIPYSIVFGNHDREQGMPADEISRIISEAEYSINPLNEAGVLADFRQPILASDGSDRQRAHLYLLDSGDYTPIKGVGRYAWFSPAQVQWMRDMNAESFVDDKGVAAPALAFFHIPFPEYRRVWEIKGDKVIGIKGEDPACAELNSGMFEAIRMGGKVLGCFCGHDHNNDFIANFCGVALGYGRYSGANSVYNNLPRGGRMIILYEGIRSFRTWIREEDGRVQNCAYFDGNTLEKNNNQVMAHAVPGFKDDFVWENNLICCRAYGKGMESETLSPGFDVWNKIPGRLVADEWYSRMMVEGGDKIYYHHAADGKDCYKVGKSLGAGSSLPVIDGKLQFPATNWRESRIVDKSYRRIVFDLVYPQWEGDRGVKFTLKRRVYVYANSYFFKVKDTYIVEAPDQNTASKVQVAVGIRNADNMKSAPRKGWPRLAQIGRMAFWTSPTDQSVEKEEAMQGTALIMEGDCSAPKLTADGKNWVMTRPLVSGEPVIYWSGNCWSKGGFKSQQEWFDFVKEYVVF